MSQARKVSPLGDRQQACGQVRRACRGREQSREGWRRSETRESESYRTLFCNCSVENEAGPEDWRGNHDREDFSSSSDSMRGTPLLRYAPGTSIKMACMPAPVAPR